MDHRIALSLQAKRKGKPQASSSGRNSPEDSEDAALLSGRKLLRTSLTGSVQTICALTGYLTYGHVISSRTPVPPFTRALRAALYGATVFLSFFLMLIFMTYNVRSHFHFLVCLSLSYETLFRLISSLPWLLERLLGIISLDVL